jgi:hypothetical protein
MSLVSLLAFPAIFPKALAQTSPASQSLPQKTLTTLELASRLSAKSRGRTLTATNSRCSPDKFSEVEVEQHGIDVEVDVADAGGKVLAQFDSESRIEGHEQVSVACDTVHYQLIVKPKYFRAPAGRYQIQVTGIRPAKSKTGSGRRQSQPYWSGKRNPNRA